jgi:hypothetical protein
MNHNLSVCQKSSSNKQMTTTTTPYEMMQTDKLYYLASPYSHPDPKVREERYNKVNAFAVRLMTELRVTVIEPIVSGHPKEGLGLPTDFAFWEKTDKLYIDHCDGIIVLMLDGWRESKGVTAEIKYAEQTGKPVIYVEEYGDKPLL